MQINNELKKNLIADVENICEVTLNKETKESLKRCFEITIGTHIKSLNIEKPYIAYDLIDKAKLHLKSYGYNGFADNSTIPALMAEFAHIYKNSEIGNSQVICPECACNKVLIADSLYVCRNKDCEHHWSIK